MTKTYINNAIVGNSRMLGCLSDRGELVRLFWPNIDYQQHIERMTAGVFSIGQTNSTLWMHESHFSHSQSYIRDTNILETVCEARERGLKATQTDYILPGEDVMVRHYDIENTGDNELDLGFALYSSCISTTPDLRNTLFDFTCDALIHYKHGNYMSISADREVYQFQLGNNAFDSAGCTVLNGYDSIGMMQDGALSWKLGVVKPGEKVSFKLNICFASTLKGVKKLLNEQKNRDAAEGYKKTRDFWLDYLNKANAVHTGREDIDNLYKRTLLVFKLMADEQSGGLMAAPEIDEGFTRCGRYAYCWGRDAAFITEALDKCGLNGVVDKFYEWAVDTQDEEGSWQQRYHMDGNLAPSWGLQIDETGTLIWGMLRHFQMTGDRQFLEKVWESVKRGINFLISFTDSETGLPGPSYDLWEERIGEHAYSSAAVCGGIKAGVEIARLLDAPQTLIDEWETAWIGIKKGMEANLWKEDRKCFLRSIRTKLNPWGGEYSPHTTIIQVNPKGYRRDVTLEDGMIDTSLLGVCIPFGVFDVSDPRVQCTVDRIEQALASPAGGIRRYENDGYIGGNPWVITTLWVALYYAEKKDYRRAKDYFEWAVKARTGLDLLPEQVDKDSGKPAWVIPLTWSHAMFILVLFRLIEGGAL